MTRPDPRRIAGEEALLLAHTSIKLPPVAPATTVFHLDESKARAFLGDSPAKT
jgi:hypothetical protein